MHRPLHGFLPSLILLIATVTSVGCGEDDIPELVRLNERLFVADIQSPGLAQLLEEPEEASPRVEGDVLIDEDFEENPLESPFFGNALSGEPRRVNLVDGYGRSGSRGLAVTHGLGPVHLYLPAEELGWYEIQVRVKPHDPVSKEATIGISSLRSRPDFSDTAGSRERLEALNDSALVARGTTRAQIQGEPDEEGFYLIREIVPPRWEREGFRFALWPGVGHNAVFDDLVVRRLSRREEFERRRLAGEPFNHPMRMKINLEGSVRDCLVTLPPTDVTFTMTLPEGAVLQSSLGLLARDSSESAALSIRVDGDILWERELGGQDRGFQDVSLNLGSRGGDEVQLHFSARARSGSPLVLWAHPTISSRKEQKRASAARNIVLISLDTLRADSLGAYGYDRPVSPRIDALAANGIRFAQTLAPAAYTLPTHATLLSGQHPLVHGARRMIGDRLDPGRTTLLSETLRERGFVTAAFTGGGFVDPEFGFDQGFDRYDVLTGLDQNSQESSRQAMEIVLEWLGDHGDSPFFLFLHTYMIHEYAPREEYLALVEEDCEFGLWEAPLERCKDPEVQQDPAQRRHFRHLYDATIRQADEEIVQSVLDKLHVLGLRENTLVCIVSDHGETIFERGSLGHGRSLHHEIVHVPWILSIPNGPQGVVVEEAVSTEAVAPLLADLAGGESFSSAYARIRSDQEDRFLFSSDSTNEQYQGIQTGGWKLTTQRGHREAHPQLKALYHVAEDPRERVNLAESMPQNVERLERLLLHLSEALEKEGESLASEGFGKEELSGDLRKRLQELGYLDD